MFYYKKKPHRAAYSMRFFLYKVSQSLANHALHVFIYGRYTT